MSCISLVSHGMLSCEYNLMASYHPAFLGHSLSEPGKYYCCAEHTLPVTGSQHDTKS